MTLCGHLPTGTIYSINPLIIIILVPFVSLLTKDADHFTMIRWGSLVSTLSPFWLCATAIWASVMFVITLSVGEALYSPRVYDYTMMVCEGAF